MRCSICENVKNTGHIDGIVGIFKDVFSEQNRAILTPESIKILASGYSVVLSKDGHWWFEDMRG